MRNYKFDDTDPTVQPVPVIISEGKFEGMKVQYGRISFDEKDDEMALKFDYRLMDNPNNLEEDQEFVDILGEVLMSVLEEEIEEVGDDFLKEIEVDEDS